MTISLFGAGATLIFGLVQTQSESRELTVRIISNEELTIKPDVEGLAGYYKYQEEEVKHLWSVRLALVNTGDKTIVGSGAASHLVDDGLQLQFSEGTTILKGEVNEEFEGTAVQISQNDFKVRFSQWRVGEAVVLSFLVKSEESLDQSPVPALTQKRPIIDGVISFDDNVLSVTEDEETRLARLVGTWDGPLVIAGTAALGLVWFACSYGPSWGRSSSKIGTTGPGRLETGMSLRSSSRGERGYLALTNNATWRAPGPFPPISGANSKVRSHQARHQLSKIGQTPQSFWA